MKRPILIVTIGFIIGIILGLYFKIGIAFIFILILFKKLKKTVAILLIISTIVSYMYILHSEQKYSSYYAGIKSIHDKAVVVSEKQEKQYYSTYIIKVRNTNLILQTNMELNFGDLIEFQGNFELPNVQRNYGGFNYREYLKTKNIYGIVRSTKVKVLAKNQLSRIEMVANAIRENIKNKIIEVDNKDTGGLLIRHINRKQRKYFGRSANGF